MCIYESAYWNLAVVDGFQWLDLRSKYNCSKFTAAVSAAALSICVAKRAQRLKGWPSTGRGLAQPVLDAISLSPTTLYG